MNEQKKLYRSEKDKVIAGVCGGLGEYFAIDSLIVRLIFLALLFGGGAGFLVYIIFALIVPSDKEAISVVKTASSDSSAEKAVSVARNREWRLILGIILLLIGISSLLSNFWPFHFIWKSFWPLLLIFAGFMIIFKKK